MGFCVCKTISNKYQHPVVIGLRGCDVSARLLLDNHQQVSATQLAAPY